MRAASLNVSLQPFYAKLLLLVVFKSTKKSKRIRTKYLAQETVSSLGYLRWFLMVLLLSVWWTH